MELTQKYATNKKIQDFHPIITKLGENDLNVDLIGSKMWIFDLMANFCTFLNAFK